MKIASIDIKEFRQFKNLKLDLTYPEGHEKAGEPLDKVCIIGQSGTGKTNLLELIYGRTFFSDEGRYFPEFTNAKFIFKENTGKTATYDFKKEYSNSLSSFKSLIYFYPIRTKSPFQYSRVNGENHFILGESKATKYVFAVSNAFGKKSQEEVQELVLEKENWEKHNPNPLEEIAEILDPIIEKFGLKTRLEITSLDQLGFINLIDKEGYDVSQEQWSTTFCPKTRKCHYFN